MKTVLKLCIIAVVLVLGVSSCLKDDNNDSLSIAIPVAYILQTDDGFIPQMRLQSLDLKSASLSLDSINFNFKQLNGSFVWEVPMSYGGILDSVSSVPGTVIITGINGTIQTYRHNFFATTKKIGDIDVDSLKYNPIDNSVYIKLNSKVDNATTYYLMAQAPVGVSPYTSYTMWIPTSVLTFHGNTFSEKVFLGTSLDEEATYKFAIGASRETTMRIDDKIEIATIKY